MPDVSIITGITGQDGAYLARFLLQKGHSVIGLTRSYSTNSLDKIRYLGIQDKIKLVECDLSDLSAVMTVIGEYQPDEIYNLAAQSSVSLSFSQPVGTFHFNTISVFNLLESVKLVKPDTKVYQASSSEMFGEIDSLPINHQTVLNPKSPYAVSKASAHWISHLYRESYNLFVCCGILFNHESFLRNENFFVKKVIASALRIRKGKQKELKLGNLDLKRDFGFAPQYVESMYHMLRAEESGDFMVCSGKSVSLREIVQHIFQSLDVSMDKIVIDKGLFRPNEIHDIYGEPDKKLMDLGWSYDLDFFEALDLIIEEELLSED